MPAQCTVEILENGLQISGHLKAYISKKQNKYQRIFLNYHTLETKCQLSYKQKSLFSAYMIKKLKRRLLNYQLAQIYSLFGVFQTTF